MGGAFTHGLPISMAMGNPSGAVGPGSTPAGVGPKDYNAPLWCTLPDGPPNARGPLEVLVGPFTDLYRLSWEIILVIAELYSQLTTCSH